jgi:hypothetical protein
MSSIEEHEIDQIADSSVPYSIMHSPPDPDWWSGPHCRKPVYTVKIVTDA